jgi:hypothetical protein
MTQNFKKENSLEKRLKMKDGINSKYPDKIPVIIQSNDVPITKIKFLIDKNYSFSYLQLILKKFINLEKNEAVFYFIGEKKNTIPKGNDLISDLYFRYHDEDGFLYFFLSKESVFG